MHACCHPTEARLYSSCGDHNNGLARHPVPGWCLNSNHTYQETLTFQQLHVHVCMHACIYQGCLMCMPFPLTGWLLHWPVEQLQKMQNCHTRLRTPTITQSSSKISVQNHHSPPVASVTRMTRNSCCTVSQHSSKTHKQLYNSSNNQTDIRRSTSFSKPR